MLVSGGVGDFGFRWSRWCWPVVLLQVELGDVGFKWSSVLLGGVVSFLYFDVSYGLVKFERR